METVLTKKKAVLLSIGALGIVFGDIGTSPLYAMQTIFAPHSGGRLLPTEDNMYGIISLIFWAITIIVTLKYILFVMRADNQGEGGIMALTALLHQRVKAHRWTTMLTIMGLLGACFFFGESIITPAISVLSATEGLEVIQPSLSHLVVPLSVIILIGLFMIQRIGTHKVGRMFGPVMLLWFSVLLLLGLSHLVENPAMMKGLLPTYAIGFLLHHGFFGFLTLSAVVLTVTGAEALYADMGHFGRPAITRAWLCIAFPALIINYLGQASLILKHPQNVSNPFFLMAPEWARIPLVILAAIATVIASQAVISGAYSVSRQAVQLGYLPRLRILHTSNDRGQIYVPAINWLLLTGVLLLVLAFESSTSLANAYGIAVTGTIAIVTTLFFFYAYQAWHRPLWLCILGFTGFIIVDLAFFTSCLSKFFAGGWIPVFSGGLAFLCLMTWQRGRQILTDRRQIKEGDLQHFVDTINALDPPLQRTPGAAVFLHVGNQTTPLAMRANFDHNHSLHESSIILWISTADVPYVSADDRITVDDLGYADDGIIHITATYGFQDQPNIPEALRQAQQQGMEVAFEEDQTSYFLSKMEIRKTRKPGMSRWRKGVFKTMLRAASDPVEYFGLPYDRTVIMGSHIEL